MVAEIAATSNSEEYGEQKEIYRYIHDWTKVVEVVWEALAVVGVEKKVLGGVALGSPWGAGGAVVH